MLFKFHRYATVLLLSAALSLLLLGCGGGGGADGGVITEGGFTITGKITLSDGTPVTGANVKLYKTSYSIHLIDNTFYSTRDANGIESITLDPAFVQSSTNEQGVYKFSGVYRGKYTIMPASGTYVYKWSQVPTRSSIGVVTITESGMVYIYNPEGSGNKISDDGTIIYNTGIPFVVSGKTLAGQDFEAALAGGI